ncbi:MAG TPA: CPBP family glutamic-type intramembrane protease [Bacillus sp. (in: firmicutes)]|nr:CPBP family glutamic-type intramembrane protease [Bacillus sp. (in: firmicutes)]
MVKVKSLKLAVVLAVFSVMAFAVTIPYIVEITAPGIEEKGISTSQLIAGSLFNMAISTFIFSFVGAKLAPQVHLNYGWIRALVYRTEKPAWDYRGIELAIGWGVIGSALLVMIDQFVFSPLTKHLLISPEEIKIKWWMGLSTILQGGVIEEISLRLGWMTIIVWGLFKLFVRHQSKVPAWMYWAGIVLAALIFGAGHLGAAAGIYEALTPLVISRIIVINSLLGIGFGYLYWKKGLEYAIIAHMTADFMLHFVMNQIIYMLS